MSESFEVHVTVALDAESARVLAGLLLGDERAEDAAILDLVRELTNVAAGGLKQAAELEGRVLTTGLPLNGASSSFRVPRAKARNEWVASCGDSGATLCFEVQCVAAENRHVPIAQLRDGMVLAHDLLNAAGALLMRGGTRLTEVHRHQLPRALGESTLVTIVTATP